MEAVATVSVQELDVLKEHICWDRGFTILRVERLQVPQWDIVSLTLT